MGEYRRLCRTAHNKSGMQALHSEEPEHRTVKKRTLELNAEAGLNTCVGSSLFTEVKTQA